MFFSVLCFSCDFKIIVLESNYSITSTVIITDETITIYWYVYALNCGNNTKKTKFSKNLVRKFMAIMVFSMCVFSCLWFVVAEYVS